MEANCILEPVVRIVYNNLQKKDAEDVIASIHEEWDEIGPDGDFDATDFVPILAAAYKDIIPTDAQYTLACEIEGLLAPLNFVLKKMQAAGMLAHVVVPLCEMLRVNYGNGSRSLVNWRIPDRSSQFVGRAGKLILFRWSAVMVIGGGEVVNDQSNVVGEGQALFVS